MSNLLLITDVARLRMIFGRLTDDKNIRLRVVTNLEKGGEEIELEKPDVVFVQTHLSGLSADILLMHLKKLLGHERSSFILLAAPGQINDTILKQYQGWLDTSAEDRLLLSELQQLIASLLNTSKKNPEKGLVEPAEPSDFIPQPESGEESTALLENLPVSEEAPVQKVLSEQQLPASLPPFDEPSLEEQGITYSPRQRLKVYSEFNSSFDSAVSSTPDPETLEQATPPPLSQNWNAGSIDTEEAKPGRSKRGVFLLWLAPVVIAVFILTYFQQQRSTHKPEPVASKTAPSVVTKPPVPSPLPLPPPQPANQTKESVAKAAIKPAEAVPMDLDKSGDKAILTAISEKREKKTASVPKPTAAALFALPKFIPAEGLDKKYGVENPGWELYMGEVTEFRVFRKDKAIKVIQVIDRGWSGVSERFMQRAFRQVTNNKPVLSEISSEKKEGYEIKRGSIAENIKVVYYRDQQGGKLRAFVLRWQ